jgi:site-specific recombinase XerD
MTASRTSPSKPNLLETLKQAKKPRPRCNLRRTLVEARAHARAARTPKQRGRPRLLAEGNPLRAEIDAFITSQSVRLLPGTVSGERSTLDGYAGFLTNNGRVAWNDVTEDDAAAFLRSLRGRGLTLNTVVTYSAHLTAFHNFLRYRSGGPHVIIRPDELVELPKPRRGLETTAVEWLEDLRARDHRSATLLLYWNALRRLCDCGAKRGITSWRRLGPTTLAIHLEKLTERGTSQKSIREAQLIVRRFFEYLSRRGYPTDAALAWLGSTPVRGAGRGERAAQLPDSPLSAAVVRYLDVGRTIKRLSEHTLYSYESTLRRYVELVHADGFSSWRDVPITTVQKLLRLEFNRGVAAATSVHTYSALRNFFLYLAQTDQRHDDWFRIGDPPQAGLRLPEVLERADVQRLLESIEGDTPLDLRDRALLELAYATGCRSGELLGLRVETIDFSINNVRVIGKGDKQRDVPFGREAAKALLAYIERGRPKLQLDRRQAIVFLNRDGRPLTRMGFGVMLKQRAWNAGIRRRIYPHILRHTCATHLHHGGMDIRTLQELLGHAYITTTQRYTHINPPHLIRAFERSHPRA